MDLYRMDLSDEQFEAARLRGCEAVLTRNPGDRRAARLASELRAELADWRAHGGAPWQRRDGHAPAPDRQPTARQPEQPPRPANGRGALIDALDALGRT